MVWCFFWRWHTIEPLVLISKLLPLIFRSFSSNIDQICGSSFYVVILMISQVTSHISFFKDCNADQICGVVSDSFIIGSDIWIPLSVDSSNPPMNTKSYPVDYKCRLATGSRLLHAIWYYCWKQYTYVTYQLSTQLQNKQLTTP